MTPAVRAWLVVAAGFLALAVSFTGRALLGLTMTSWEDTFDWSRSFVSASGAVALVVTGIASPIAGNIVDRFGPRPVLTVGLLGLAAAGGLASVADQPWQLVLALGILGGVGYACVAQHVIAAALAARFDARRGLATGLAISGSTAGQLLLIPLMAWLLTEAWRTAPFMLNALLSIAVLAVVWATVGGRGGGSASLLPGGESLRSRLGRLWRHPTFVALFASFTLCGFTTTGVVEAHLFPYAALCGYVPLESAQAYSVLAAFNLIGMVITGWLTDKVHRPLLLATIFFLRAVSFIVLMRIADDLSLLFLFAAMFGILNFSVFPVIASLVASHLGVEVMGLALGLLFTGHSLGAAIGMVSAGVLYDLLARYLWTWLIALVLAVLAGIITLSIRDRAEPALAAA
ncbi:MAG: MFS transporter [Alphaproteobacteria bacterium]|nr:MFS transporter [Alphaproteobacteria bacterium]